MKLSGSILKLLAVITMVIDHIGAYMLNDVPACTETLFTVGTTDITVVWLMRTVGRLAFPLFCFLMVEGFYHTHDRSRYGRQLLLFALLSEIPWDLINHGRWFCLSSQNVFFSLWLGYLAMVLMDKYRGDRFILFLGMTVLAVSTILFRADYGMGGFLFMISLYVWRRSWLGKFLPGIFLLPTGWAACLASIPCRFYNGTRGFIKGNWLKFTFYIFYPVHLLVLWWLK